MSDLIPEGARHPVVFARNGEVFANSRDVAAFFEKRHDNVLRDIDNLIAQEPALGLRSFAKAFLKSEESNDTNALSPVRTYRAYDMDRDGFTLLAMGFTGGKALGWKLKYIEAFNTMEAELRAPRDPMKVLNDPAAMRGLLLTYTEKVLALEADKAALTPKAEALDRIAETDGLLTITDAAKTLGLRPSELFRWLRTHSWIYKRLGNPAWIAYQDKMQTGYLDHKVSTFLRPDGSEKTTTQAMVTPKGLTKLAALLGPSRRLAA